ncbi:MAG TPA: hypothetical protein VK152_07400, partial [Paludibacter sp.]|nr:hypothetical protein [Paludibacter sp.]
MRFTLSTILFALGCLFAGISARTQFAFSEIDSRNTLSDNRIRNIAQLTDGRMLVITEGIANLFDGTTFKHIHKRAGDSMPLTGYYGFHHSYVEGGRVWIKNYQELMLIDIGKEAYENHPDSVLKDMGINEGAADLFVDVFKNYWVKTISDNLLFHSTTRNCTRLFTKRVSYPQNTKDELFDIATVKNEVFLFYKSGLMLCYDIASAKLLYKIDIFNAKDRETYNRTLIVVQDRNYLYTLRNNKKGIMQAYNTHNRTWSTVLNTDYWLNTISIDNNGNILVSCKKGLWEIDKSLAEKELTGTFRLVDGTDVTTEASTLFNDNQGGFWIGTFNHGLLYYHADRFKFTNIGKLYFNSSGEDIVINCFSELLPGKILIGTNKGVFSCSSLGEEIRPIPMALNAGACYTMTTFGDRVVLQTDKGNYVYDGEHIVPANSFFSDTRILCPTSAGRFLVFDNSQKWGIANPANYQVYPLHFNQNPVNPGSFRKVIQFNENEFLGLTPHEVFCINTGNKPSKSSAILP